MGPPLAVLLCFSEFSELMFFFHIMNYQQQILKVRPYKYAVFQMLDFPFQFPQHLCALKLNSCPSATLD